MWAHFPKSVKELKKYVIWGTKKTQDSHHLSYYEMKSECQS
jgi:hypothetical protein